MLIHTNRVFSMEELAQARQSEAVRGMWIQGAAPSSDLIAVSLAEVLEEVSARLFSFALSRKLPVVLPLAHDLRQMLEVASQPRPWSQAMFGGDLPSLFLLEDIRHEQLLLFPLSHPEDSKLLLLLLPDHGIRLDEEKILRSDAALAWVAEAVYLQELFIRGFQAVPPADCHEVGQLQQLGALGHDIFGAEQDLPWLRYSRGPPLEASAEHCSLCIQVHDRQHACTGCLVQEARDGIL
mmetsp:Transcript_72903/g.170777  ORF Transcript_72903/g.170777 Transcript_72903/m.170777 type:complete len:238 (+) Transcript_72903:1241-1954(+)